MLLPEEFGAITGTVLLIAEVVEFLPGVVVTEMGVICPIPVVLVLGKQVKQDDAFVMGTIKGDVGVLRAEKGKFNMAMVMVVWREGL
jgi:hypothetical protein